MNISEAVCVAPAGDRCGEGPVWHAAERTLYWTDINRFLIHRFDPDQSSVKSWYFDEPVTALALTDREDVLVVALGSRMILWNSVSDERKEHGFALEGWPDVRLNDGRADPRGSFWAGSMRNNVNPDGSEIEAGGQDGVLYRIDPDGVVSEWKRGVGISNTLAWSPDHKLFYFGDSLADKVFVYEYDESTGSIGSERSFLTGHTRVAGRVRSRQRRFFMELPLRRQVYRSGGAKWRHRQDRRDACDQYHKLHVRRRRLQDSLRDNRVGKRSARRATGWRIVFHQYRCSWAAGKPFPYLRTIGARLNRRSRNQTGSESKSWSLHESASKHP